MDQDVLEPVVDPLTEFLTSDEWDLLTEDEQVRYLELLQVEQGEWRLQPKQQAAYDLADAVDDCLYGGAAGPGKTEVLLYRAWRKSLEIPGHHTLVIRATFPRLQTTIIRRSIERYDHTKAKWRASEKSWKFNNGSIIQFGFCADDDDVGQYLSTEYDMLLVDELTELTAYQYRMLRSRVRTTKAKAKRGARPHAMSASNPGQRGHLWVKEMFIDPTENGKVVTEAPVTDYRGVAVINPETGEQFIRRLGFMPGLVQDNAFIDVGYLAELAQLPENEQRMYLFGDWDCFEGQFFASFARDIHVCQSFDPPPSWPRFVGIDYGSSAPFCALWAAVDWDGRWWVYREIYEAGLEAEEQARKIVDASKYQDGTAEKLRRVLCDPSMFAKSAGPRSPTIAARYQKAGLKVTPANNDRVNGWSRIRGMLRNIAEATVDSDWRPSPPAGAPNLIVSESCKNLLRTLPSMPRDPHNPEDIDTKTEDHACDALRYLTTAADTRARRGKGKLRTPRQNRVDDDDLPKKRREIHPQLGAMP